MEVFQLLAVANGARAGLRMEPCHRLLAPVYTEFMPPIYQPTEHGCSKGNEPGYTTKPKKNGEDMVWPYKLRQTLYIIFGSVCQ